MIIILIVLVVILFFPMRIIIRYRNEAENKLQINISLINNLIKFPINSKRKVRRKRNNRKYSFLNKKNILFFIRRSRIEKFSWTTHIGCGDAALTAVNTGILWSLKYNVIAFLFNNKKIKDLFIEIIPEFNENEMNTSLACIINTKMVHIIIIGIKIFIDKRW